jgi:hypothetical protein
MSETDPEETAPAANCASNAMKVTDAKALGLILKFY